MSIQPIETLYKGHRMRSRLEARWSVFFDALGLRWRYEPEGFELPGGKYLPDFWVDGIGWIEIKPTEPTTEERIRIAALAEGTGKPGFILGGTIPRSDMGYLEGGQAEDLTVEAFFSTGSHDWGYWFCICPQCEKVGMEWQARSHRICGSVAHPEIPNGSDRGNNGNHPRIIAALDRARGARFEYGEKP